MPTVPNAEPTPQPRSGLTPWLATSMATVLASQAHAQLVEGAAGLGQFDLALAAAAAWLCETPGADRAGGLACGHCDSCRAVDAFTHHDLQTAVPETVALALGVPLSPKAQDEIDSGKRKPSKQVRVESVLGLVDFAQRTSARGRGKVALVYPAERMNDVAANALLKVLEEPPGDMRFLLVCESGAGVMPTIRSRCQAVRLQAPDPGDAAAWLARQTDAPDASGLLSASGGSPWGAMAWAAVGMTAVRWAALPGQVAARQSPGAEPLAGLSLAQAIEALQKICHDVTVLMCGGAPRYFAAADLAAWRAASPRLDSLNAWWGDLVQQARHAEHPVVLALALEALVVRARRALHSGAA